MPNHTKSTRKRTVRLRRYARGESALPDHKSARRAHVKRPFQPHTARHGRHGGVVQVLTTPLQNVGKNHTGNSTEERTVYGGRA